MARGWKNSSDYTVTVDADTTSKTFTVSSDSTITVSSSIGVSNQQTKNLNDGDTWTVPREFYDMTSSGSVQIDADNATEETFDFQNFPSHKGSHDVSGTDHPDLKAKAYSNTDLTYYTNQLVNTDSITQS